MARKKMLPEYFLNRIREFQKKNGRPPRSDEFNAPFHGNIMKYFGSWQKAVQAALGITLNHAHKSDAELTAEIKNFLLANGRIPNYSELKSAKLLCIRFGSYAESIGAALSFNPEKEILRAIQRLTSTTAYASLYEIAADLAVWKPITRPQVRGFICNLVHLELVEIRRGDRIALYKLSPKGRDALKTTEAKRAV